MDVGTPDRLHVTMPAHGIPSCLDLRHDPYKLDLAFIVDGTDSVNRQDILTVIGYFTRRQSLNVRIALVEYYSHRTEDHVGGQASNVFCNFTETIADLTDVDFHQNSTSQGRGFAGRPTALADGLHAALHSLNFRDDATKIVILIADSPPHGLTLVDDDPFPDGCPQNRDPIRLCREMAKRRIILLCIGNKRSGEVTYEPSRWKYTDLFMGMSCITGGQYLQSTRESGSENASKHMIKVIKKHIREEIRCEIQMGHVDDHVELNGPYGDSLSEQTIEGLATSFQHFVPPLMPTSPQRLTRLAKLISYQSSLQDVQRLYSGGGVDLGQEQELTVEFRLVRRSFARRGMFPTDVANSMDQT